MDKRSLHPLEGKVVILEYTECYYDRGCEGSVCLPYEVEHGKLTPLINLLDLPQLEDWNENSHFKRLVSFLKQLGIHTVYVPVWQSDILGIKLGKIPIDDGSDDWSEFDTYHIGHEYLVRLKEAGIEVLLCNTIIGEIIPD